MIFYIAKVKDTDGVWHMKVGKTKDMKIRFKDKRLYLDHEYIASRQFSEKYIDEVENEFKEYTFTATDVPSFKFYRIKIVMTSTSQSYPPRMRNLRVLALA